MLKQLKILLWLYLDDLLLIAGGTCLTVAAARVWTPLGWAAAGAFLLILDQVVVIASHVSKQSDVIPYVLLCVKLIFGQGDRQRRLHASIGRTWLRIIGVSLLKRAALLPVKAHQHLCSFVRREWSNPSSRSISSS